MSAPTGKTYFLGIGIDQYHHWTPLRNAVRDVRAIAEVLVEDYGLDQEYIRFLCDEEATEDEIIHQLEALAETVTDRDSLIIYYAGHGYLHRETRGFWVPVDAPRLEGPRKRLTRLIRNSTIRDYIKDIESLHTLLIADSCFSGSLFVRGLRDANWENVDELASLPSRWVISSGRQDEPVADGPEDGHSPFAQSIIDVLHLSNREAITTGLFYEQVREQTRVNYDQQPDGGPLQGVGHKRGQYVFRRRNIAAAGAAKWVTIQALPDDTLAQVNTKRIALRRFVREYDKSPHLEAALRLGRDLDYKREFLQSYDYEFALLAFIRKDTPYRESARRRLEELEAESAPEPEFVPPPPNKEKPKAKTKQPVADNDMVRVEGGTFIMGCQGGRDKDCFDDEKPAHEVTVDTFFLGRYQVTNAEFAAFLNSEGNREEDGVEWIDLSGSSIRKQGDRFAVESGYERHPVICVSWHGAHAYAAWLRRRTGQNYRLPTEAEWEYAARGGQAGRSDNYLYSGSNDLDAVGWYDDNSGGNTHPVGKKQPNQLGLYDMSGNVLEWCNDWHGAYPAEAQQNPKEPDSGSYRVLRGGSWSSAPPLCRVAYRYGNLPAGRVDSLGFRVVLAPVQPKNR